MSYSKFIDLCDWYNENATIVLLGMFVFYLVAMSFCWFIFEPILACTLLSGISLVFVALIAASAFLWLVSVLILRIDERVWVRYLNL